MGLAGGSAHTFDPASVPDGAGIPGISGATSEKTHELAEKGAQALDRGRLQRVGRGDQSRAQDQRGAPSGLQSASR
jgi:hypothetical protein